MSDLRAACEEYHRRVAVDNSTIKGADHAQILDDIALEYGIEFDVLSEATLDQVFARAN